MKSFITHLETLYPDLKWFDKSQIKVAYANFLREQLGIIYPQRSGTRKKESGLVEKKVTCRFHKWYLKIVKTTMSKNQDGLTTIYYERKVDHLHVKFLKDL